MRAPGPTTVRMRPRISGAPQQSPKPPCLLQYVETELKVAQLHVAARETDWTFAHRSARDCFAYPPHKDSRSIVISLRNFPRKCLINPWIVFSNIGRHVRSFGGRKRFRTALGTVLNTPRHGTGPFSKTIIHFKPSQTAEGVQCVRRGVTVVCLLWKLPCLRRDRRNRCASVCRPLSLPPCRTAMVLTMRSSTRISDQLARPFGRSDYFYRLPPSCTRPLSFRGPFPRAELQLPLSSPTERTCACCSLRARGQTMPSSGSFRPGLVFLFVLRQSAGTQVRLLRNLPAM